MRDVQIFILGFIFAALLILLGAYIFERIMKRIRAETLEPEPRVEYKFVHTEDGKEKKKKIEEQEDEENHFFQ